MTPTIDSSHIIEGSIAGELDQYLSAAVAPQANRLDDDAAALFTAFRALGNKGWLLPKGPQQLGELPLGGLGLDTRSYQQFQSVMARHSGALAFLQTQHQSAASLLLSSENKALQQQYLPGMATGKQRLGVGFSQLRRQRAPLTAQVVEGGYRLNGVVPWVTGAGLFTAFVGAAVLPEGSAVFGLLPFVNRAEEGLLESEHSSERPSERPKNAHYIRVGQPMALAGMAATSTVQVRLKDWFLADEQVVGTRPSGWIEQRDRANPLSPLGLIFGCTQAGLDVLTASLQRRRIEHEIAQQLTMKLAWLKMDLTRVTALPEDAYAQKIAFRGKAIALMSTCAQAAIVAASGAANTIDHPAQRIYKESLVFSVSGQTTDGAIAALNYLSTSE